MASESKPLSLSIRRSKSQTKVEALAAASLRPSVNAALVIGQLEAKKYGDGLPLDALVDALAEQLKRVNDGEMSRAEAMLAAQAHTLDALFSRLAEIAVNHLGHEPVLTPYLKLALKTQSQCQATLRTLGELKNPKQMAFIKQANMSQGHQQINNAPRAETENQPNELLEATNERLDTEAQRAPEASDTAMAAMAAVHGTED